MPKPKKVWVFYWNGVGDYPVLRKPLRERIKLILNSRNGESAVGPILHWLFKAQLTAEEMYFSGDRHRVSVSPGFLTIGNNPWLEARKGILKFDSDDLIVDFEPENK
jgi:hypothetical protein